MSFWQRVEAEVSKQKTTFRWISEKVVQKAETTVSGWRRLNVLPRIDDGVAIAKALGVSAEYLVTGEDPQLPSDNARTLIKILQQLPEADQEEILAIARLKLNRK